MIGDAKDSDEVIEFMYLFARLKEWCDDDPNDLVRLAEDDDSILDICVRLSSIAEDLKASERKHRELFAAPIDPDFIREWRDYEKRYEAALPSSFSVLLKAWGLGNLRSSSGLDWKERWTNADNEAATQSFGLGEALNFAFFNADDENRWDESKAGFIDEIKGGIKAWDRLKENMGFDLRGVFRRRALVPFVLVPRHVAAKHGSEDAHSMLKNLQQAHEAFVYGAHRAALALMRSILEVVLRDNYGTGEENLCASICKARQLPREVTVYDLHRLRKLANLYLHLNPEGDDERPIEDETQLEKEIVSLLLKLRALIEGAPSPYRRITSMR